MHPAVIGIFFILFALLSLRSVVKFASARLYGRAAFFVLAVLVLGLSSYLSIKA